MSLFSLLPRKKNNPYLVELLWGLSKIVSEIAWYKQHAQEVETDFIIFMMISWPRDNKNDTIFIKMPNKINEILYANSEKNSNF